MQMIFLSRRPPSPPSVCCLQTKKIKNGISVLLPLRSAFSVCRHRWPEFIATSCISLPPFYFFISSAGAPPASPTHRLLLSCENDVIWFWWLWWSVSERMFSSGGPPLNLTSFAKTGWALHLCLFLPPPKKVDIYVREELGRETPRLEMLEWQNLPARDSIMCRRRAGGELPLEIMWRLRRMGLPWKGLFLSVPRGIHHHEDAWIVKI